MTHVSLATILQAGAEVVVEVPPAEGAGRVIDFVAGGFMMYPITISGLVALGLSAWAAWRLWGPERRVDARVEAGVDGVLFWGGYALLLGILGTVVGVARAAQAVERAGEIHTTLLWGGIRVALITTILGALILGISAVLWFALRVRCRTLLARMA